IADIAQQAIQVQGWTSEREFADLFALSRAAPGPGSMLAALIGWKAAGIGGAAVATIAFYVPSAALVLAVARLWGRWRGSVWHTAPRQRPHNRATARTSGCGAAGAVRCGIPR